MGETVLARVLYVAHADVKLVLTLTLAVPEHNTLQ